MSKYLYRKTRQAVTLAAGLGVLAFSLQAQYRPPQAERKTPRAVGVLETYKNGSRRLIPVTFFYERHYYDATLYHATPVPFTLYSETVYEVEQYGKALGTFTVRSATRNQEEWFGNGRFKPAVDETLLAKKTPRPVVLEDPTKPVLHRRAGSEGDRPGAHPADAPGGPPPEDDPDRPKLHKRAGSGGDAAGDGKSASASQGGEQPQAVPAGAKVELTPSEDRDHPILRRGKPVQEQSGRDLPDFKREEPVSRQVAVSDAGRSEAQSLIFVCREEERKQMEAQARELAQAELRRLAPLRGLTLPQPKAAAKTPVAKGKKKAPVVEEKPPELALTDEQMVPYELDYSNYATVVYSARYVPEAGAGAMGIAVLPAAGAGGNAALPAAGAMGNAALPAADAMGNATLPVAGAGKSWVVTVVARQAEDKLVKLYSAVSDPRELDLYPEVRLVDAVDPDGYGHYGLLFREQKRDGVSWLLGRPTGYELQTLMETAAR
jgi:hypothetical protein